jgi:hypothetical protein
LERGNANESKAKQRSAMQNKPAQLIRIAFPIKRTQHYCKAKQGKVEARLPKVRQGKAKQTRAEQHLASQCNNKPKHTEQMKNEGK